MAKAILTEVREIALLASMVLGLSVLTQAVACAAVIITDNQTQHVAALAPLSAIAR